jgi:hypothetical protein
MSILFVPKDGNIFPVFLRKKRRNQPSFEGKAEFKNPITVKWKTSNEKQISISASMPHKKVRGTCTCRGW